MNEGKKTKPTAEKTKTAEDAARPHSDTVGEMLRVARTGKKLSIEEVSVALRIRASQLRAIEENNIDALPGMTYAVGFIRSYANYLGLDGIEVVHKFKAEHGHAPAHPRLSFPEPVAESRMPDPLMVGVGAFLAIVVLVVWTIYSNTQNGTAKMAEQVPPAPAVESILPHREGEMAVTAPEAAAQTQSAAVTTLTSATAPAKAETIAEIVSVPVTEELKLKPKQSATKAPAEESDEVINIKREKSRIVLQSKQAGWIEITDSRKGVIYKKVLKPGDKYYVPDQPGLSLSAANAGGLEIYVDGQQAPSLGKSGEILRGVSLDPSYLKRKKIKVNN